MQNPFKTEKETDSSSSPFLMHYRAVHNVSTQFIHFFPLTSWCDICQDAGDSLLLQGEDIAMHSSYHYAYALPAAIAPAGFFCLSSVLNSTIQKCYLADALNPALLL